MENTEFTKEQKNILELLLKKHCEPICKEIRNEVGELKEERKKTKVNELESENKKLREIIINIDRKQGKTIWLCTSSKQKVVNSIPRFPSYCR
ncbi:hypothetical protein HHI36_005312 [Cryptolaemus montrouzieri]|uniref:Uncharacterized protein n=1 Tax=Cryptolaemus montrouzieri TaxID=559131 RepID=A0ABD2NUD1_9CUCU